MTSRPLEGRGIVVTRPAGQAGSLVSLIAAAGGRPFLFPAIEIEVLPRQPPPFDTFDVVVFVSPTAVQVGIGEREWPAGVLAAAVGAGTRRALEHHGVAPVLAPDSGADSEALLALEPLQQVAGKHILIVRGEGGRELLATTLAERGARVQLAECYRRLPPSADAAALCDAWERGEVHALTVSSATGLDNLLAALGRRGEPLIARTPLFVTHARIAEHAARRGLSPVAASGPGDEELVAQLVAYFGAHE